MLGINKLNISKLNLTTKRIEKEREEKESLCSSISRFIFKPLLLLLLPISLMVVSNGVSESK